MSDPTDASAARRCFGPVVDTLDMLPALMRSSRLVRGLSLREAADQIPYPFADLCRFESGRKNPTLSSVVAMIRWLADGTVRDG